MPTPGQIALQESLGNIQIAVPGFDSTTIDKDSDLILRISIGMHAGWLPLYPTTVSNCEVEIKNAFNGMVESGWPAFCWIKALGKGIDIEMTLWVASWEEVPVSSNNWIHTYEPSISSIYSAIVGEISSCNLNNDHTLPIAYAVAETWMVFFGQETG